MFSRTSVALLAALAPGAIAWGPDGHATVAQLGDTRMSPSARRAVTEIMGDDGPLAEFASWPDMVRYTPEWDWSVGLHFINTPSGMNCQFDYSRDCPEDYCAAGAVRNYTAQLGDTSLPMEQRNYALRFLVHFMGDMHEPLHVGQDGDQGGNTITVHVDFADEMDAKLHKVWDEKIVDQFEESLFDGEFVPQSTYEYGDDRTIYWDVTFKAITEMLQPGGEFADKVDMWVEDCETMGFEACIDAFAQESAYTACSDAYKNVDGSEIKTNDTLTMAYYESRSQTVLEQIAKAGVRLAYILDQTLSTTTTTSAPTDCSAADLKCGTGFSGSYCKYWQTPQVCFGNDVPCSC